ncbi:Cmx/CmrA family chloramphenicol efflux MFS transporter [Actinomadura keratinilytica]|uniref:MFS transporter n=1 Tax=Actinomadura keratinilytica TaxID=547461 RepID=A0ABP7ZI56_9ACTN
MPFAIYVLGLAVFAQGTSEFMLSGLVEDIARDMGVSIGTAGTLTSAFALGMIIGAPLMAAAGMHWPRRRALLVFLLVFMAVHVAGAVTADFAVLLGARVVGALANAGFLAVAVATAAGMAAPNAKGRATAVLLAGVTLACVAGVPGGAVLGQLWGWRAAFWAVVVLSVPAVFAIVRSVPAGAPDAAAPGVRGELRALRSPRLLVILLLGALVNGATFCGFTYLAPLVTNVTGLAQTWVPLVLALFGLGSFAGVTAGGRLADTRPLWLLGYGGVALLAGWAVFALSASCPAATLLLVFVQGTLSFGVGSTLISQALYAATEAPTLAGGFSTAALNVGAMVGPSLGAVALDVGLGYRSPLWISALLAAVALLTGVIALTRGPRPRTMATAPTDTAAAE